MNIPVTDIVSIRNLACSGVPLVTGIGVIQCRLEPRYLNTATGEAWCAFCLPMEDDNG